MTTIFDMPIQALLGQLALGLVNGSFYALLSLGLAVIFGLLRIVNVAHGAQYMLGAYGSYLLLTYLGIGYWPSLLLAPIMVAVLAIAIEKTMLSRFYDVDHLYGFLLTFGLAMVIEGMFSHWFGSSGRPYSTPTGLGGAVNLGFLYLPYYRAWVVVASIVICFGTWALIERTRLGVYLRAATENASLVQAFGVNVPRLLTLTYALGAALAALAGVFAGPIYQVSPGMGSIQLIIIFAVVVVGGMGSILGAIVTGYLLGLIEGLTKVIYPQGSAVIIFVIMLLVLLVKPAGLFGKQAETPTGGMLADAPPPIGEATSGVKWLKVMLWGVALVALLAAPHLLYPVFLMKVFCFALFALAFNLAIGYSGLFSFGHAAFFGGAAYFTAHAAKSWGWTPEIAILFGVAGAAGLGLVLGFFAIRRHGITFAMITLALAQMFYFIMVQSPFTHAEDGIQDVPRGRLFGLFDLNSDMRLYYFVLIVFVFGMFVTWRIVNSPFGNVLRAIRDNEPRAISLGYRVRSYKLAMFVLSAAITGLAGATKVLVFQIATLTDVEWHMSGEVILMTLLGGIGTFMGPIVGAGLVVSLQTYLASSSFPVPVLIGTIFVACVLLFRQGIVGQIGAYLRRRRDVGAAATANDRGT